MEHDLAVPFAPRGPRARRRRWRVPPALLYGPEALEGGGVLGEVRGELGLVLWQALRDTVLWAETPPSERVGLFTDDAEPRRLAALLCLGITGDLEQPLQELARLAGRPERAGAERVGLACREVVQWAEAEGKPATALAFAQAAALTCPGDAAASFKVGQLARKQAQYARAESWLRRTVPLGRQSGDWASYALAFSGLGNLYVQRGNFPAARRFHMRALRAAKRHCLHSIEGDALHDLFVIAVTSDRVQEAEEHARAAFDAYGPEHPRIPNLAHDVAYFWMTQGYFERALAVFRALLPYVHRPAERLATLSNIARAAGGCGKDQTFEEAWKTVWETYVTVSATEMEAQAEAFLELAYGATSLAQWDRAERAVHRALELAEARREARVQVTAETVMEFVKGRRHLQVHSVPETSLVLNKDADNLAEELVRSLNACAAVC